MVKIVIACDNDNLLNILENNTQIETIQVEKKETEIIKICKNNFPDMLILDFNDNGLKTEKIIKKIYELDFNKSLVISATNSRTYICFDKIYLLLDLIKLFEDFKNTTLEEKILDMLWLLRFNLYSKGTVYLSEAIALAYYENSYLYDTNELLQKIAKLHNLDEKNIRNNIDNALSLAFKDENLKYDIDFFNGYYDGRKVSLKYFITLAVHYISIKLNNEFSDEILLNL